MADLQASSASEKSQKPEGGAIAQALSDSERKLEEQAAEALTENLNPDPSSKARKIIQGKFSNAISDIKKANEPENIGERTGKAVAKAVSKVLSEVERRKEEQAAEALTETLNPDPSSKARKIIEGKFSNALSDIERKQEAEAAEALTETLNPDGGIYDEGVTMEEIERRNRERMGGDIPDEGQGSVYDESTTMADIKRRNRERMGGDIPDEGQGSIYNEGTTMEEIDQKLEDEASESLTEALNPDPKPTSVINPTQKSALQEARDSTRERALKGTPTFRGEKMNEEQKSRSQPQAPKDAAGVELRPYCRIAGVPEGKEFYVRTRDVIEHIEKSKATVFGTTPWDKNLEDLRSKEISSEEVAKASGEEPEIPKIRISLGGKFENVHENIICRNKSPNKSPDQNTAISFIPASNNVEGRLIIGSLLDPVKVTQGETIRHYSRADVFKAMNQGEWEITQDNQGECYETPKDSKNSVSKMEDMLLGLDPITIRPAGSKKDIYLEDHLESSTTSYMGGRANGGKKIDISKNRITGNLAYNGQKNFNRRGRAEYNQFEKDNLEATNYSKSGGKEELTVNYSKSAKNADSPKKPEGRDR